MMTKQELLKTAKSILFSTEMVHAILDNRKTQFRQPVKPEYIHSHKRFARMNIFNYIEQKSDFGYTWWGLIITIFRL